MLNRPIQQLVTSELTVKNTTSNKKIPDEKVDELLNKLRRFEIEKGFKKQGISLDTLAKKMNTNSRYLSEVINNHLGKNFNAYLNELRINYLINELKSDPTTRKLKLDTLANKIGYANRQSFNRAFQAVCKLSSSVFIKNLEEQEELIEV